MTSRIRTLSASGAAAALLALAPAAQAAPETFTIDTTHSNIVFLVDHLGYAKMVGEFQDYSGEFTFDPDDPDASSVSLTIQAGSVDTDHDKRDQHLTGPDFLNAAEFPTITFESTGVEVTGERRGELTGELTMLGETRPITLDVTFNKMAENPLPQYDKILTAGFSARGTIERSNWGVDSYVPSIGDEIRLILEIEGQDQDHDA
jgi:polyisoprenoid-binding protein YceI